MIVTRLRQISLLLIAMAISALAFIQMFQRTAGEFPMQYAGMLALAVVLFLVLFPPSSPPLPMPPAPASRFCLACYC